MAAPIVTRLVLNTASFKTAASGAAKALKPLGAGLGVLAGVAKSAALAVGLLGTALSAIVIRQTKLIAALKDTSDKLGVNIEFLQKFRYAAEQSGVGVETADMALQRFTRRISEAAQGTGEARGALAELGIQVRDNNGNLRSMEDILFDVADGIANTSSEADRVRLAFKFFDSEGVALVNTLNKGSDALKVMFNNAESLGGILTYSSAAGVKQFDDALTDLSTLIAGVTNQFVAALAPALEALTQKFVAFIQETVKEQGGFEAFGAYLKDQFISILQAVIKAFVKLYNVIVVVVNGVQKALAKLGLIDSIQELQDDIDYLREDSKKPWFSREVFKTMIGSIQELKDEFGTFEYFNEEDYDKAISILEQKIKDLKAKGEGGSLLEPITEEQLAGYITFFEDFKSKALETNKAVIEEVVVTGKATGMTLAKILDDIFGVERMTEFWTVFDDEASTAYDKLTAFGTLLKNTVLDFIKGIGDKIQASGVGDYMKTLEDGFVSAVQKFEGTLADAIVTGKADFSSLADHIKRVLAQALVQKLITAPLLGMLGLPMRAEGGPVAGGKSYIVGEKGPEIFTPNMGGQITSNEDMNGMGGGQTIVYNISAVDTQSFKQALAKDPEYIYSLTQAGARRMPR